MQDANDKKNSGKNRVLLQQALDETINSLGGPIYKTITWHMNSKGLFTDSQNLDLKAFYINLRELIGPGADMIMEDTWQWLKKRQGPRAANDASRTTPLERIQKFIEVSEA